MNKNVGLKLSTVALAVVLASCGGGGYYDSTSSNAGANSGTGTDGSTTSVVNVANVELYNVNNIITNSVTAVGVTAKVKVTDASGKALSGALVTFTGSGILFGTTNGTVLSNVDGEASISVKPENLDINGAYQISATADFNGVSGKTKQATNFVLQAANIVLVNMVAASTSLESGASTNITLKTQDATTKVNQNNVSVTFSTSCGTFEPSTIVSSNQGDVTTAYKAIDINGKLCEEKQTITATGSNISAKTIEINIAAIEANSLVYSSDAVNLGIKSSGSASSGQIEFTLYSNGTPAANKDVNIELLRAPNDLSFVALGNRAVKTLKSNPAGKVFVTIYPGNIPGPVEIKATLDSNTNVSALSKNVAVSTGRVTQAGLSLSVSKNSLQNVIDGDTATITARMVDRTGNPIPDGTVISFVAEGGSITPNCASTAGQCSVTLSTQNPRPLDNRVTVLAYLEGDKTFRDENGDNVYTAGIDTLTSNIGDFFRDDNEDNIYNANLGEYLYKRSAGNLACALSSIAQPNIAGTCDTGLETVIRQQLLFAFAENTPTFANVKASESLLSFNMYGNSAQSVPMPTGTTLSVTVEDNTKNNDLSCSAELATGSSPVANVFNFLTPSTFKNSDQSFYGYRLKECAVGDMLKLSVASPDKKVSTIYVAYE